MRMAQMAPLFESVSPQPNGGTEPMVSALTDGQARTSHDKSYQSECPKCRSVAALEANADPLQTFIKGVLPRAFSPPFSPGRSRDELTPRQQGASDWSFAIRDCLRQAMAAHPRCGACSVLMGPGHEETRMERFCGTHREIGTGRLAGTILL
jgi:hypothetical protein